MPQWSDLANSKEYQSLNPSERDQARRVFFDKEVAPKLPERLREEAFNVFVQRTEQTEIPATIDKPEPIQASSVQTRSRAFGESPGFTGSFSNPPLSFKTQAEKFLSGLGGPAGEKKFISERIGELGLSEEPLSQQQRADLTLLSEEFSKRFDPERRTSTARYLVDNFQSGVLGEALGVEPGIPPHLTGSKGTATQIAGAVANLSGFGLRLSAIDKLLNIGGNSEAVIEKLTGFAENKEMARTLQFLQKHKDTALSIIKGAGLFGADEFLTSKYDGDTLTEIGQEAVKKLAHGAATGALFEAGAIVIGAPIKKVLKSEEARDFVKTSALGASIGAFQPTKTSWEEDPWQHTLERLENMGAGATAFAINHALWSSPKLAARFANWSKRGEQGIEQKNQTTPQAIFEEISDIIGNPIVKRKGRRPKSDIIKFSSEPNTPQRLREVFDSSPTTHPGNREGWKKEIKALGRKGFAKDVFTPPGLFTGQAPTDIQALKAGTYKGLIRPILTALDKVEVDKFDVYQRIEMLQKIIYQERGAKTKKTRKLVDAQLMKDMRNPESEKNPVVKEILLGYRDLLKKIVPIEQSLGYKYVPKENGYIPEVVKDAATRREITQERIRFGDSMGKPTGEVFLASAKPKTGRGGTVEDFPLQLKTRLGAFSKVRNLSQEAREFSFKYDAIREFLHPEIKSSLDAAYNQQVQYEKPNLDRLTDNTLNGIMRLFGKEPVDNISKKVTGTLGGLQSRAAFSGNTSFGFRNKLQVLQSGAINGWNNTLRNAISTGLNPEAKEIVMNDPELSNFYKRVKRGEHTIDQGKGNNFFFVGKSHMSNIDGTINAALEFGKDKMAKGLWTKQDLMDNLYWAPRITQYAYDPARVPQIFKTAAGRELFRFKSWGINKMFYYQELLHRLKTGTTGFGAPLEASDRARALGQILWESSTPALEFGGKNITALNMLRQMKASKVFPSKLSESFGITESLITDLVNWATEPDDDRRQRLGTRWVKTVARTHIPFGGLAHKIMNLGERGWLKTFVFTPTANDYKQWAKARRKKQSALIIGGGR